jgi:hypothetical protein
MADYSGMILTNNGIALQVKAEAGAVLNFTKVKIGDGQLADGQTLQELNDLINPLQEANITSVQALTGGQCRVRANVTNEGVLQGFYVREVGLFAQDPDAGEILYAIATSTSADFLPAEGGATAVNNQFDIIVVVGNASQITAVISVTGYALLTDFNAHLAEIVTEAAANKILKLDANAKLPASITGDAPTVGGRAPGVANGVATLDVGGNVPANQLGNVEMRYESGEWTDTTTSIDVGSTYTKNITLGFNAKIAIIKVANTTGGERGIIFANGSNSTRTYGLTGPTSTSQYTYGYLKSIDSRITRDGSFGTNIYISDAYITGNVLTIKLTNNGGVPNPMKISAYYEVIG